MKNYEWWIIYNSPMGMRRYKTSTDAKADIEYHLDGDTRKLEELENSYNENRNDFEVKGFARAVRHDTILY